MADIKNVEDNTQTKNKIKGEDKNLVVGDVIFGNELSFFNMIKRDVQYGLTYDFFLKNPYEDAALEIMKKHNEFYEQFQNKGLEEYITNGVKVSCNASENHEAATVNLKKDHGVIGPNGQPLLTCKDCEEDLFSNLFGRCSVDHSEYDWKFEGENV